MPQPTRLDALAAELAAVLQSEHGLSVAQQSLVELLADRRDAVAAALHIQPRSALHYLDTETIRELATSIASAAAPPPTPLDDLDPDAPINAVHCAHYEPPLTACRRCTSRQPAYSPTRCLTNCSPPRRCASRSKTRHHDCAAEHRDAGPHQHLRLHLNPAADYGHDDCVVASSCIGCMPDMFDDLIAHRAGWIRRYIPTGHRWVGQTRFQLVNTTASLAAIQAARARLTPA
jgi:hypothetical protein